MALCLRAGQSTTGYLQTIPRRGFSALGALGTTTKCRCSFFSIQFKPLLELDVDAWGAH
ncbi:MAG: hypothetical protein JW795_14840 [Chitinivibrionales bacterium]|nr:hypothetical protein [Chitinivibrionales bacterium]